MALHNLTITVVDGGSVSSTKSFGKTGDKQNKEENTNTLQKILNYKQTISNKFKKSMTPTSYFAMEVGTRMISQTARQTANYFISDIGRSHGDSNYQAQINRKLEVVGDVMSIGGGVISGAAAGSMFGPVGTAVGAVAGLVTSAVNTGFKYAERERDYQHERFKEKNSQAYNLSRAGFNVWSGRLR